MLPVVYFSQLFRYIKTDDDGGGDIFSNYEWEIKRKTDDVLFWSMQED